MAGWRMKKGIAARVTNAALLAVTWFGMTSALAAPAFVQVNSAVPQSPQSVVTATFTAAQAAGNFNVVVVGWSDTTSHIQTVTDTRGNVYSLAVGPTVQAGVATQSIYYSAGITASAAGTNVVRIQFDAAANYVDLRIAEYSGVDPVSPLDVVAAATGSSATSSSGAVTTTNAENLLIGANLVQSGTAGAGTGFTSRIITNPDSDILEDRVVTAIGSYSATAPLTWSHNWIMQMAAFRATSAGGGDTQAPTAPSSLGATAASSTQINLSWTASTDNVGVTNYLIERCQGAGCSNFAQIGTSATTTFSSGSLTASTSYSYRVRATDAGNNLSGYSNVASATTSAAPDTQAPTAPSGLGATAASSTQINLSWSASTDNVGVTNYLIERCQGAGCSNFAQIGTSATTTFSSGSLTASTSYSYRVRATDAGNNLSGYSNVASATTTAAPDTQAPTAPSSLGATATSSTQINLSWTASTDNVGVTNYLIERCQGAGCSNFAQIGTSATTTFSSGSLAASTSYSYRVRATDDASNLSGYSNVASATTLAPPDTQAPTAPASLGATTASSTQINLSWTASTDNVGVTNYLIERCQGAGCSNFAQIGTSATTTFNNSGLSASTSYSYRVRATDTANNLSSYSNTASATTSAAPDTQAPTAPSGLGATVASSTQINLSWVASTDNVGVTNYLIERCQGAGCSSYSQVGTSATTTFNNSGLTASTTYSYRVRATDAANNLSGFSNTATATTSGGGAAPIAFVQTNNAVPQSPQTTVTVPFTAAQSAGNLNVVAVGWFDTTSSVLSVTDTRGHTYVRAVGPTTHGVAGTHSIYYAAGIAASAAGTNSVTVTFNAAVQYPDVRIAEYRGIDPTNPVDVVAAASGSSATSNSGAVTTTNANDLLVGANYVSTSTTGPGSGYTQRVITSPNGSILEDRIVTTTGSNSATAPLQSGSWIMQLVAFRAASAGGGDTQAPTAPTGLGASAVSSAQINLSWTGSTDDVGVTNYLIERCSGAGCSNFAQVGTSATPSFNNTGLAASTSYSYRVRATDAANNLSGYSNAASATTQTIVDTQAPTAPTNLTATPISGTQINLSWTASSDNVGVTNYLIERCQSAGCTDFAQIATSATTSFSNTGLTVGTTYLYRVRATDAASNLSAYSSIATGVTPVPDTQAPTAPSGLTATAVSSGQINLSWTASTDNVAVTNYLVERCSGAGCSNFAQVGTSATTAFNNTGLTGSTSYSYRVRATDAANNLSGYSGVASATTQQGQQLPPLSFVQGASAIPQAPVTSVNAAFAGNQIGGRLNVVAIGWFNTTSQITSVTDTAGNTYVLAAGPTTQAQAGTHAIYYAAGINASAANNRVTVTFNNAVPFPDLRIAEYAGVDPSDPLDSGVEASGTGATSSSGSLTTASPNALLVAANYVTTSTNAPGSGFTTRMITNPNGSILEDRIVSAAGSYAATASLSPAGSWIMQMVAFRGGPPPPPDTTPPSISLSGPAPGTTLSGTATLQAMASDLGSGVAGVQFQVDGINVGPAINNQPYQLSLNTALFANGTHVISVYGWDQVRNIATSTSVTVTFNNGSPGAPAVTGLWQGPFPWPLVSIHLNLLSDGRLLAWDQLSTGTPDPRVWDPVTSAFTVVPVNDGSNLFCSGHSTLPDGRLFVAGGEVSGIGSATANSHVGLATGHIFNPATNLWTSTSNMQYGRWYPTQTTLPDGRVLTLQGETNCFGCDATVPEIYNATNNTWTQLNSAQLNAPWYPYTFVLPNGRIAVAGGAENADVTRVLDLTNNTWTTVDNRVIDGGSAAMYLPGKVIKSGTSNSTEGGVFSSTANAWVIDFTAGSPAWRAVPSMAFPRTYHVMTQLPDGSVLVTGGGRTTGFADIPNAVKQAELWSPTSETWTTLASMSAPRLYHQTAVLLPDARVLVSGSGRGFGRSDPTDQLSGEIFAPPYLFKGPRPTITSAPSQLSYGQVFNVNTPNAANIAKVTLVRTSSVTHTFNMDTRYLPLTFTAGSGSLSVTAPANANLAPPGYYMLFIVDNAGVPSVSAMVRF